MTTPDFTFVEVPFLGANDTEAVLKDWCQPDRAHVEAGEDICVIETTKAAIEIQSAMAGYVIRLPVPDGVVKVGQKLAVVARDSDFDPGDITSGPAEGAVPEPTMKAKVLIKRHRLDPAQVAAFAGSDRIDETLVQAFIAQGRQKAERLGFTDLTRVGILGGVAGGGALIAADSLLRVPHQRAAAIYDQKTAYHGQAILGTPIRGDMEQLLRDVCSGEIEGVFIAFNRDLEERHKIFERLRAEGVEMVNIIDPTAEIRAGVIFGTGNIVLGRAYIGAGSVIGDNNFISANVMIEHGNRIGDSCAFGPGVFTSGNVTIGDRVRFGTGIFVEPWLSIGSDAVIGSGNAITASIDAGATLMTRR